MLSTPWAPHAHGSVMECNTALGPATARRAAPCHESWALRASDMLGRDHSDAMPGHRLRSAATSDDRPGTAGDQD